MADPQKISREAACAHLKKFPLNDPLGNATAEGLTAAGQAYELDTPHGRLVYVVAPMGSIMWVAAAAGATRGITPEALHAIERQSVADGALSVAFQTSRLGLVKQALQAGYRVKGWILEKAVKHERPVR